MIKKYKGAIVAQKFINEITKGDRRIILLDGEYAGSVARIPKKGSKAAKRRKSFCARSDGQRKKHNINCRKTPNKRICQARKRWKC